MQTPNTTDNDSNRTETPTDRSSLSEMVSSIAADRVDKRNALYDRGYDPYQGTGQPDLQIGAFRDQYADTDEFGDVSTHLAGRVTRIADVGAITFIDIRDETGTVQLLCRADDTAAYDDLGLVDRGDVIAATGTPTRSDTGELSLAVAEYDILTKALCPPPDAGDGFTERNRVRQRAAALQLSDLHETIRTRFELTTALREVLRARGYREVETPVLHQTPGGAAATPFETYSEALDTDLYLRIAPELYLKRLVVGGFDRVFEIGKVFRNEDIDSSHNPEFTMLELYRAYADYTDMMTLTEELVAALAERVIGTTTITSDNTTIDLSPPWPRLTIDEAIAEYGGIDVEDGSDDTVTEAVATHTDRDPTDLTRGECLGALYDAVAEPNITGPAFITHHPRESTPLCQPLPDDPARLQRFEVVVNGVELANAYTEHRDPAAQVDAFLTQLANRTDMDATDVADRVDMEYVRALAYGMPPTAGLGIGVDRLAMLLTGCDSIKEVLPFPLVAPE